MPFVTSSDAPATSSFLFLVARPGATSRLLFLVEMPFAPSLCIRVCRFSLSGDLIRKHSAGHVTGVSTIAGERDLCCLRGCFAGCLALLCFRFKRAPSKANRAQICIPHCRFDDIIHTLARSVQGFNMTC